MMRGKAERWKQNTRRCKYLQSRQPAGGSHNASNKSKTYFKLSFFHPKKGEISQKPGDLSWINDFIFTVHSSRAHLKSKDKPRHTDNPKKNMDAVAVPWN